MTSIACKYFVQNEGDENASTCSNFFILSKKYEAGEKVKFKDLMAEFPLANMDGASYHLRVQTFLPEAPDSPIWVDITNEEANVPLAEPGIVKIKALKLPPGLRQKIQRNRSTAPTTNYTQIPESSDEKRNSSSGSEEEYIFEDNKTATSQNEKQEGRNRINSGTKSIFEINIGLDTSPENIDLAPPLEPTTYKTRQQYSVPDLKPEPTSTQKPNPTTTTTGNTNKPTTQTTTKPAETEHKTGNIKSNPTPPLAQKPEEKSQNNEAYDLYEEKIRVIVQIIT